MLLDSSRASLQVEKLLRRFYNLINFPSLVQVLCQAGIVLESLVDINDVGTLDGFITVCAERLLTWSRTFSECVIYT